VKPAIAVPPGTQEGSEMHKARFLVVMLMGIVALTILPMTVAAADPSDDTRSLDGTGNNRTHNDWGSAGAQYLRVAPTNYADGIGRIVTGPNGREVSNRIFNDVGQNIFSETALSQWAWAWGQFLDHDIGLRDETPAEDARIKFFSNDPLEQFDNDTNSIA